MDKINPAFASFAKEINFPISFSFKDAKLANTELNESARLFSFKFECRATIPFDEMHEFLKLVNKNFGAKAKLEFSAKTVIFEIENIKRYLAWILSDYLKEKALAEAVRKSRFEIKAPLVKLEINDAATSEKLNEVVPQLTRVMHRLGFAKLELKINLVQRPEYVSPASPPSLPTNSPEQESKPIDKEALRTSYTKFNRRAPGSFFDNMPVIFNPEPKSVLTQDTLIIFDLETTGLRPKVDEIIEFGAAKITNGKVVNEISFFIKPRLPLHRIITQITGITDAQVKNGLSEKEALEKIIDYFNGHAIIAHNASFDIGFLNDKLGKNNMPLLKMPIIDTMICGRIVHPEAERFRLEDLAKRYGVKQDKTKAHRAGYDVEVLTSIWLLMVKDLEKLKIITQGDLGKYKQKN